LRHLAHLAAIAGRQTVLRRKCRVFNPKEFQIVV